MTANFQLLELRLCSLNFSDPHDTGLIFHREKTSQWGEAKVNCGMENIVGISTMNRETGKTSCELG